jgi:hypothetical protein
MLTREALAAHVAERLATGPAAFAAWLNNQPETARYRTCQGDACPLHAWLTHDLPAAEAACVHVADGVCIVGVCMVGRYRDQTVAVPVWANTFTTRLDDKHTGLNVSPMQALETLED